MHMGLYSRIDGGKLEGKKRRMDSAFIADAGDSINDDARADTDCVDAGVDGVDVDMDMSNIGMRTDTSAGVGAGAGVGVNDTCMDMVVDDVSVDMDGMASTGVDVVRSFAMPGI